jgi:hypothetical protein
MGDVVGACLRKRQYLVDPDPGTKGSGAGVRVSWMRDDA